MVIPTGPLDQSGLEHGVLPYVVPLDLGHLPDTQRYFGLLS